MNLENQVTNLSISKRLSELGLKQESYAYWVNDVRNDENAKGFFISLWNNECKPTNMPHWSAFTASELANMLPHIVNTKINEPFNNFRLCITKSFIVESDLIKKYIYIINYHCDTTFFGTDAFRSNNLTKNIHAENLADAMALMLIYLIENQFITI